VSLQRSSAAVHRSNNLDRIPGSYFKEFVRILRSFQLKYFENQKTFCFVVNFSGKTSMISASS
jgi:hypothetical protein